MQTNVGSLLSYLLIYLLHTDKSVYICSIVIDSPRLAHYVTVSSSLPPPPSSPRPTINNQSDVIMS